MLYPGRLPPAVRALAEAVNEGHAPERGVFITGGVAVVNWVVRATILGIEAEHWKLTQKVAGESRVAMRRQDRAMRLLATSPWPHAHAAATVTVISQLAKAVCRLERGVRLQAPAAVRQGIVLAEDADPRSDALQDGDLAYFRAHHPDGVRVTLAALRTILRSSVPEIVKLRGGIPRSSAVVRTNLREHDCGNKPVVYAGAATLWTARALRALAKAGAEPAPVLRVVAAFLDQNQEAPRRALPPRTTVNITAKTRWTPAEDAVLVRFFDLENRDTRPTNEEWEFLLSRLSEPHRDRARARARAHYLRRQTASRGEAHQADVATDDTAQ